MVAADILLEQSLYPSCCHPAYYSCIQLMKYTIYQKFGITYQQQEIEISSLDRRVSRSGSHNYLIDKIVSYLNNIDKTHAKTFKRDIEDLKNSREEADYKNISIGRDDSERAIRLAKKINLQLTRVFGL